MSDDGQEGDGYADKNTQNDTKDDQGSVEDDSANKDLDFNFDVERIDLQSKASTQSTINRAEHLMNQLGDSRRGLRKSVASKKKRKKTKRGLTLNKDKIQEGINESGDEEDQGTGLNNPSTPQGESISLIVDDQ